MTSLSIDHSSRHLMLSHSLNIAHLILNYPSKSSPAFLLQDLLTRSFPHKMSTNSDQTNMKVLAQCITSISFLVATIAQVISQLLWCLRLASIVAQVISQLLGCLGLASTPVFVAKDNQLAIMMWSLNDGTFWLAYMRLTVFKAWTLFSNTWNNSLFVVQINLLSHLKNK